MGRGCPPVFSGVWGPILMSSARGDTTAPLAGTQPFDLKPPRPRLKSNDLEMRMLAEVLPLGRVITPWPLRLRHFQNLFSCDTQARPKL